MTLRCAYLGNIGDGSAAHSTENHVGRALTTIGVQVHPIHEQRFTWRAGDIPDVDFVLWTHTHGFAPEKTHPQQFACLDALRHRGTPVVSYHLDRYWDLYREKQITGAGKEPFFSTDLMCSADGGNDQRWSDAGIAHEWFPPAVSAPECEPGTYRPDMASDIAFVGSWDNAYHHESRHRRDLIRFLVRTYGDRCAFWPKRGQHAIRNEPLRDLYASAKVLVGDSCFSGDPRGHRYYSDRIPETIGRGGLLIHPDTPGVTDGTHYTAGEHLLTWPAGDWKALRATIAEALASEGFRRQVADAGRAHVLEHHTYERRMVELLDVMTGRGLLGQVAA